MFKWKFSLERFTIWSGLTLLQLIFPVIFTNHLFQVIFASHLYKIDFVQAHTRVGSSTSELLDLLVHTTAISHLSFNCYRRSPITYVPIATILIVSRLVDLLAFERELRRRVKKSPCATNSIQQTALSKSDFNMLVRIDWQSNWLNQWLQWLQFDLSSVLTSLSKPIKLEA